MVAFGPNSPYYIGKMPPSVPESTGVTVHEPIVVQKALTQQYIQMLASGNNPIKANFLQIKLDEALRQPNGLLIAEALSSVHNQALAAVELVPND